MPARVFERGKLLKQEKGKVAGRAGRHLRQLRARPGDLRHRRRFNPEHVERRLRLYSFLNAGLRIEYNGQRVPVDATACSTCCATKSATRRSIRRCTISSRTLELAFTHTQRFGETFLSFVNGQYTADGGTHLSAFREGPGQGRQRVREGQVRRATTCARAWSARSPSGCKDPVFESQTKNKLGNTEMRGELVAQVREIVADLLHRNPKAAEKALAKIEETVKLRKELQSIKKMARERARATSIRIPQLKDCKVHFDKRTGHGEESMIFITEGQSAAGSIVSCRDVNTQAIFTLRGKPLNVCDLQRDVMYKNEELYNLMRSLDIEDSAERLRYNKVILATDADVDGLHIRNLLLTFFLRFFEPLVHDGHVYILETPLFRVRNAKKTEYCYSEAERDAAAEGTARGRGHALQGAGRDLARGVQALHRPRHAPDAGAARPTGTACRHSSASTWAATRRSAASTS